MQSTISARTRRPAQLFTPRRYATQRLMSPKANRPNYAASAYFAYLRAKTSDRRGDPYSVGFLAVYLTSHLLTIFFFLFYLKNTCISIIILKPVKYLQGYGK